MKERTPDPRIPKIVELVKEGKNWSQISEELSIPRRSLYNIRHSEGFLQVAEDIWLQIWADIKRQREIGGTYNLDSVIKHQIRMFSFMAGANLGNLSFPKEVDTKPTAEEITADRKRKEALIKSLKFSPRQYKILELHVQRKDTTLPPDWKPPAPVHEKVP